MDRKKIILICTSIGIALLIICLGVAYFIHKRNNTDAADTNSDISGDVVTRYEWIEQVSRTFGLEADADDPAFFSDVDNSSEYYEYVQGAAHWGVISGDSFDGGRAVTGEYAALTVLKAIGEYKIKIYMEADDILSDKEYLKLAVDTELIDDTQKKKDLSEAECDSILNRAKELSESELWKDDYAKIEWQDGVCVYDSADTLKFENAEYNILLSGDRDYKEGDVIVFPNDLGAKLVRKVECVNPDGSYTLTETEVDEACKSAVISDSCELRFEDFEGYYNDYEGNMESQIDQTSFKEDISYFPVPTKYFQHDSQGYKFEISNVDGEMLEIKIHDNSNNDESTIKVPMPEDLKEEEGIGFTASVDVDEIAIRGQIDYFGTRVHYMDIDTYVHTAINGEMQIFGVEGDEIISETTGTNKKDIKIPLGNATLVFESGVFSVKVKTYIVFEASGKIGFEVEVPAEYELIYEKGKGFRKTHTVTSLEPAIVLEAEANVALRPELIPGLFCLDIIDIDAEIGASAEGKITLRADNDLLMCCDAKVAAPTFALGVGLDDSGDFMILKNDLMEELIDISYKWEILNADNAPIQLESHWEWRISDKGGFKRVDECTYDPNEQVGDENRDAVIDDGVYTKLKQIMKDYNYPFRDTYMLQLDRDYEGYGTEVAWKDCGDYYEVEGYLSLANAFVAAGNQHDKDDGGSELSNTTINLCGHVLETGDLEALNRNKSVLDGLEIIESDGKAVLVNKIDGEAGWDVCFLYGPSEDVLVPHYYERYYDLDWAVEEVPNQYYYELCDAFYEDIEGNLPDITGAWFTHMLDIPTVSEQKMTVRIRKDAVMAITLDADNPEDAYMSTVQDFYENKTDYPSGKWGFYEWYAPNEYGWSSMLRARITFDEKGMIKEVVPMVLND